MVELFSGAKNITVIPLESPHSTSIVVPLKMEKPGPFAGNRADVEAYINEFYR
jgi:hypothetical protein